MLVFSLLLIAGLSDVQLSLVGMKSSFGGIGYDAFCFLSPPAIKVFLAGTLSQNLDFATARRSLSP